MHLRVSAYVLYIIQLLICPPWVDPEENIFMIMGKISSDKTFSVSLQYLDSEPTMNFFVRDACSVCYIMLLIHHSQVNNCRIIPGEKVYAETDTRIYFSRKIHQLTPCKLIRTLSFLAGSQN